MSGRIVAVLLIIAFSFAAGRFSVGFTSKAVALDKAISHSPEVADVESLSKSVVAISSTDTIGKSDSSSSLTGPVVANATTTGECLAKATRRDIQEWIAIDEDRMKRFQQTDPKFASRVAMSAADWKRTQSSGDVSGTVAFRFESAKSATLEIRFADSTVSFAVTYRGPNAKDAQDYTSASGMAPLRNGYGLGLDRDGSGYHIVIENPVQAPGWSDYTNFGFSVPFDWNGKSEITVEVFGLNEEKQWAMVGAATLKRLN
jgi:hypothetical protein